MRGDNNTLEGIFEPYAKVSSKPAKIEQKIVPPKKQKQIMDKKKTKFVFNGSS